MKEQEHLPIYGVGPLYVAVIAALTLAAFFLRKLPALSSGQMQGIQALLSVLGILCILSGIVLWIYAVRISGIDDGILENRLVVSGAYAWVRNPIYSAAMIACTGVILMIGNAWFLPLPFLYWLFMTVLMKATEEKWLRNLYGQEYEAYCRRVNRCWPWLPKEGVHGKVPY